MNVLIIEDEKIAADRLIKLLHNIVEDLTVLNRIDTVQQSIEWLSSHQPPDLIFLDIQLADGVSFDIFKGVDIQSPIIFTTAYDNYAIKAFKVNSIDYLLKPIDESSLRFAMEKYQNLKKEFSGIDTSALNSILKQLNPSGGTTYKNRFIIKSGEHIRSLKVEEIDFFVSMDKITFAVTKSGRKHIIDYNMDRVEEEVDPLRFFRINRKYIVSIDGFTDIIAYSNHRLKVQLNNDNTMEAIVSRNRVKEFKEWLDR